MQTIPVFLSRSISCAYVPNGVCVERMARSYCGGEVSRSNAALLIAKTGGMRRCHVRVANILKRQLIKGGAFNLRLILRKSLGGGTSQQLKNGAQKRP